MRLVLMINMAGVLILSLQRFPIPPTELIHRTRPHRTTLTAKIGPPTGPTVRTASWMPSTITKSNNGTQNGVSQFKIGNLGDHPVFQY